MVTGSARGNGRQGGKWDWLSLHDFKKKRKKNLRLHMYPYDLLHVLGRMQNATDGGRKTR
jgi:hypothetical protein